MGRPGMGGLEARSPLTVWRERVRRGGEPAAMVAEICAKANSQPNHNTYLHFDADALAAQAEAISSRDALLRLAPVSLKDCFDLAGTRTTFGSRFYAERNPVASVDSAMARRLRECGCLITGKTHLHPLAYGITGQNAEFGDCVQPRDASLLTGGSSSGAAASVQEGSALAAVGTDTGGSIRVPAALCGLTGYRASHSIASAGGLWPEMWEGAWALAPSFDTAGLIFRDPRDGAALAEAIFHLAAADASRAPRIGCVPLGFLDDAEDAVREAYGAWQLELAEAGASVAEFDPSEWRDGIEIFTAIQAHEASRVHAGHYGEFGPLIEQRLRWGASIGADELQGLRGRHAEFRAGVLRLFERFELLMLPCAQVAKLYAAADQATTRTTILRYTVPFSLAGVPVVTLPGELIGAGFGTGVQVAAALGCDASLLAFAALIGDQLAGR